MSEHPGMGNLSGVHFLLTYGCTSACDHCFVYGTPRSEHVFTLDQIDIVLTQAKETGSVSSVYFEGGEPFLYYQHLLEGIRRARAMGFSCGIVTNAYWASTVADAERYLGPLIELGISDLSISDDDFHRDPDHPDRGHHALQAAKNLGVPSGSICLEKPKTIESPGRSGEQVTGGDIMFKGRAVDTLTDGLPRRPATSFTCCEHEDFLNVRRVHIDPLGWVHICQGIVAGNVFQSPLSEIINSYDPTNHPIIGPLVRGGPQELARAHAVEAGSEFVDACHLCFLTRRHLIDRFPALLAPPRVYGLTSDSQPATQ